MLSKKIVASSLVIKQSVLTIGLIVTTTRDFGKVS